jgi:nucleotide-binding universal stress UspA family protein
MYGRILVAIALDHSPHINKALDVARRLGKPGASIIALHVIETIPAYAANQIPDDIIRNRRPEAEAELKAELGGVQDVIPAVVYGHAGRSIVDYAKEHDVDCIVIASHRPGLQDYFLGSTATRVVRHAACSVHVMR